MTRRATTALQVIVLVVLAVAGLAAAGAVLVNQSSGINPFDSSYRINAELTSAGGVRPSVGQSVDVAGVGVGQIVDLQNTSAGNAVVTLEIRRDDLPAVYRDATARLEPITPLKDLRLALVPGSPAAGKLPDGGTIDVAHTAPPVELSTLLSALDTDNRQFLTSLISSVGQGTLGRGEDLRRALVALGPTSGQLGRLTRSLAGRRAELARLVHNLARVTRAASQDQRLAGLVQAGNQTLAAVAQQDPALREAIDRLPQALRTTDKTLAEAASLAKEIGPASRALIPATKNLPRTLRQISSIADTLATDLPRSIRPFVREARPLVRDLGAATPQLARLAPRATNILQSGNYLLNELGYNPKGDDEGGLFWIPWSFHNLLSFIGSIGDAHGAVARGIPFLTCAPMQETYGEITAIVNATMGLGGICPATPDPNGQKGSP